MNPLDAVAASDPSVAPTLCEDLRFRAGSDQCAAWHYHGSTRPSPPCIVMAHGFGATRHYGLDAYARRFQAEGYSVLVFDYRHFGDSEGLPRGLLNVRRQQQDWVAAITFARSLGYQRIVLWGTSFAGGHVLYTAAHTPSIAAVISQVPHISGLASALAVPLRSRLRLSMASVCDALLACVGQRVYIQAFGPAGSLAAMSTPGAYDSMLRLLPNDAGGRDGLLWRSYFDRNNRVTAASLLQLLLYSPGRFVDRIPCPVLLQAGRRDQTTPFDPARRASERIADCEFLAYDVDHFDVYWGDDFEITLRDQVRFLERHFGS